MMFMVGAVHRPWVSNGDNKETSPHSWNGKQVLWSVNMQN